MMPLESIDVKKEKEIIDKFFELVYKQDEHIIEKILSLIYERDESIIEKVKEHFRYLVPGYNAYIAIDKHIRENKDLRDYFDKASEKMIEINNYYGWSGMVIQMLDDMSQEIYDLKNDEEYSNSRINNLKSDIQELKQKIDDLESENQVLKSRLNRI